MTKIDMYFSLWALFLPISSVLVFPSIQGTTPAYLLAFLSVIIVQCFSVKDGKKILWDIARIGSIFIILNLIAQMGLVLFSTDFQGLRMVDPKDYTLIFRNTMFTQSLYLLASILTFLFVKQLYKKQWDKYIFFGATFLALYGVYEVLYYIIFNANGDFLTNRVFGDGEINPNLFQTLHLGSINLFRLKSLTGEPSMYAFTILPFWIYAIHTERRAIQLLLFITLILSTSTTAILGILIYLFVRLRYFGFKDSYIQYFIVFMILVLISIGPVIADFYETMILDKITLSNDSGMDRYDSFESSINFFADASVITKLFGVGFGYIRSTDMFATLLINNGIVGLIILTFIFAYPLCKLNNSYRNIGLKASLLVIYLTMIVSVSEYSYLSIWLFLGMTYNQIVKQEGIKDIENLY